MAPVTEYTLVGVREDAVSLLGKVRDNMREEGYTEEEISSFTEESTKIDYDNLVSKSIEKLHEINQRRRENMKNTEVN